MYGDYKPEPNEIPDEDTIDIKKDEIRETIIKSGLTVGAEYLNRAVSAIGHKEREIKGGRADFYKMLPNLELILSSILKCDKNNQYIVIFGVILTNTKLPLNRLLGLAIARIPCIDYCCFHSDFLLL